MTSGIDLVVTPIARADLEDILQYTGDVWGEEQRDRYELKLYAAFQIIRDFPEIGRLEGPRRPGVRVYTIEHHLIYYRVRSDTVIVLRILNPRQRR